MATGRRDEDSVRVLASESTQSLRASWMCERCTCWRAKIPSADMPRGWRLERGDSLRSICLRYTEEEAVVIDLLDVGL